MRRAWLFLFIVPFLSLPAIAYNTTGTASAYMVENTTGTDPSGNACYDFQTSPSCSARIANLVATISSGSIPSGATFYIQNTANPTTTTQVFKVSSGTIQAATVSTINVNTALLMNGSAGTAGQVPTSNGAGIAPTYQTSGAALLNATNTWTAGQTFTAQVTLSSNVVDGSSLQGTSGQSLQSNGGSAPTWVNVPASILSTTSTWTANQTFSSGTFKAPTVQVFTSGSGTYTTPTSPRKPVYIQVIMVGAGGGGAGSGTASGGTGGTGGTSTFGTTLLSCVGGTGAAFGNTGGAGGTASLGTGPIGTALSGGNGQGFSQDTIIGSTLMAGGVGGANPLGGFGASGVGGGVGSAGTTNTGGGGQGGGSGAGSANDAGGGGGAGGYINAIIANPLATYAYTVGAAGTAGIAGTNGFIAGIGGSGYIEVREFYQ